MTERQRHGHTVTFPQDISGETVAKGQKICQIYDDLIKYLSKIMGINVECCVKTAQVADEH